MRGISILECVECCPIYFLMLTMASDKYSLTVCFEMRISSAAFMYAELGSTLLPSVLPIVGAASLAAIRLEQNAIMLIYLDKHIATGGMRLLH